jgi:radical SAM superfamily enzyme YgiQ (UPF0313 family)
MAIEAEGIGCDAILVGRRLPDNENLGLGYVLAALRRSGFRAEVQVLNGWPDLERIGRRVIEARPRLVGLSIPDGGSAFLPLGLGGLLRRRGFDGHVTAGGPFATLAREWLLGRYDWLDSVVRFAGEVPVVRLMERLAAGGHGAEGLPGITTRSGDGLPAPVLDPAAMDLVPERGDLPEILGFRAAHLSATRGCRGRCAFCGPAALQRQEFREGRAAGHDAGALRCAGVGGTRRRDIDSLCDEMAALWHDRGVRYFYFVDEHLLPHEQPEALAFLARWRDGLRRRRMEAPPFGGMFRGDRLTPAIVAALRETGLVRAFVGLELGTPAERRRYGRAGDPAHDAARIRDMHDTGIATITNLMLVHPEATLETISAGIDLLDTLPPATFETTEMRAYHGTRLWERLRAEGRLEGNPLRWDYRHRNPRVARFAEILSLLRGRAFRDHSTTYRLHDALLELALARRLRPEAVDADVERGASAAAGAIHAVRIEALREAAALARRRRGNAAVAELVVRTRHRADASLAEIDRLGDAIHRAMRVRGPAFSPLRAAAAGIVRFGLVAAVPAAACYGAHGDADAAADDGADARDDATDVVDDAAGDEGTGCSDAQIAVDHDAVGTIAHEEAACLSMMVQLPGESDEVYVNPYWWGDFAYCGESATAAEAIRARVAAAIRAAGLRCARPGFFEITSGDQEDWHRLGERAASRCPEAFEGWPGWWEVMVWIGPDGRVADVTTREGAEPPAPEILACLRSAFEGLVFPCLTGYEVCPEYVIVE